MRYLIICKWLLSGEWLIYYADSFNYGADVYDMAVIDRRGNLVTFDGETWQKIDGSRKRKSKRKYLIISSILLEKGIYAMYSGSSCYVHGDESQVIIDCNENLFSLDDKTWQKIDFIKN